MKNPNQTMISFEKFKEILEGLQKNIEYLNKVCELIGSPESVFDHACVDETIMALAAACNCDEELLFQWVFELDLGKEWDDQSTIAYGAEMKTIERLYEYITTTEEEDRTLFSIPSEIPDCPVFELTYHADEGYYSMSMETIYEMDAKATEEYVNNIWEKFTGWMIDNEYRVNNSVPLSIFEEGIRLGGPYLTIEEAYAHFSVLATGACNQGVEGSLWT